MRPITLASLFLLAILPFQSASACSCRLPSITEEFAQSDQVFKARLVKAELKQAEFPYIEGTFILETRYKGELSQTMTFRTGLGGGDCGIPFVVSKSYFVFNSGSNYLGSCGNTAIEDYKTRGSYPKELLELSGKEQD